MSDNFESIVKQIIGKYKMESLSESVGWPSVRDIRRKLDAKTMTSDRAVDAFLTLRPSYRDKKNDREFRKEMLKMMMK